MLPTESAFSSAGMSRIETICGPATDIVSVLTGLLGTCVEG
jgi:hypothetical protein